MNFTVRSIPVSSFFSFVSPKSIREPRWNRTNIRGFSTRHTLRSIDNTLADHCRLGRDGAGVERGYRPTAGYTPRDTGAVENAAFSPDNRFIVTSSEDNTARVYHLITLSDIASLLRR